MSFVGVAFSNSLTLSLWRVTNYIGNSLGCLAVNIVSLWTTNGLNVTHVQKGKLHLMIRDVQLGLIFLIICLFNLDHFHMCMYFRKLLLY